MIEILKDSLFTSIQDRGRVVHSTCSIPQSGCLDRRSSYLANKILGNKAEDALLEITVQGPDLLFHCDTTICISGAEMTATLNNEELSNNKQYNVLKGDILKFGRLKNGVRAYLAVKNGIKSEKILESRSQYKSISKKEKLVKGDKIKIEEYSTISINRKASLLQNCSHIENNTLEAYPGPEFESLDEKSKEILFTQEFTISNLNNRMAYQFEQELPNQISPIITSLVMPGTIQLTPSGKLIALMRDAQRTGGYPRVLQLSDEAINTLAQKTTGMKVRFEMIN
jgi:biotin-dependent carboxylase-like uncharacterized protein